MGRGLDQFYFGVGSDGGGQFLVTGQEGHSQAFCQHDI